MSNRKNYNSIVFLTTLSVYLGLVLAGGATPTVLAQAALTRDFDIKNEVVLEDDLDKKPDDEIFSPSKNSPDKADKQFIEQYAKSILSLLKAYYSVEQSSPYNVQTKVSDPLLADDELFNSVFPSLRKDLVAGNLDYAFDKDTFFGKLNLKSRFKTDLSPVSSSFVSGLDSLSRESLDRPETAILKSTQITFENNQIFIVTRLPRASIDDTLAGK